MHDFFLYFFFIDTATTEIYTLSLHDALPISTILAMTRSLTGVVLVTGLCFVAACRKPAPEAAPAATPGTPATIRSEEHTSELQSRLHLVCRLLLEKKKKKPHDMPRQEDSTSD